MNAQEFFDKTDGEINRAVANEHRYYYLISVRLPCSVSAVKDRYKKYNPEIRVCRGCNPKKYDVIFNLGLDK